MKDKVKDIWFWIGLIGIIGTAMGLELQMLTSWDILIDSIVDVISSPVRLVTVVMAVLGVVSPKRKPKTEEVIEENKDVA